MNAIVRSPIPLLLAGVLLCGAAAEGHAGSKRRRQSWRNRQMRNFRDAGRIPGLPLGRVFRSDDPRHNPFRACDRLRAAGIRTIVKLNGFQDQLSHRRRPVWRRGPCGIRELVVSLPYGRTKGGRGVTVYELGRRFRKSRPKRHVVRYMERQLRLMFRELVQLKDSDLPILLNCSLGRDRTGIVVALLQRIAGASPDAVEREYVASRDTVGHTSVVSLRRVMRFMRPLPRYYHRKLGLSAEDLKRLRWLVRGPSQAPRAAAPRQP